jgi:hypothetical protein
MNIGNNISGPSPQRQAPPRAQMMQSQFQNAQQQPRPGMVSSQYQPQVQNTFQLQQQQQQQPDPKHDHLVSELMHEVESKRSELENMTMSVVQWKQNFKDKLQQEKVSPPSLGKKALSSVFIHGIAPIYHKIFRPVAHGLLHLLSTVAHANIQRVSKTSFRV